MASQHRIRIHGSGFTSACFRIHRPHAEITKGSVHICSIASIEQEVTQDRSPGCRCKRQTECEICRRSGPTPDDINDWIACQLLPEHSQLLQLLVHRHLLQLQVRCSCRRALLRPGACSKRTSDSCSFRGSNNNRRHPLRSIARADFREPLLQKPCRFLELTIIRTLRGVGGRR